nr:hypothetical protein [Tanacetum cinerariifolium]
SYEHYKGVGAEVELLEPGFELQGSKMGEIGKMGAGIRYASTWSGGLLCCKPDTQHCKILYDVVYIFYIEEVIIVAVVLEIFVVVIVGVVIVVTGGVSFIFKFSFVITGFLCRLVFYYLLHQPLDYAAATVDVPGFAVVLAVLQPERLKADRHGVEFQRISLTRFRSCASRSQTGASQSRQSTDCHKFDSWKNLTSHLPRACLMLALAGFPSSLGLSLGRSLWFWLDSRN